MKELHKKLQVVLATVGTIKKGKENPFFNNHKYADINDILATLEPIFEEVGLLCLQPIRGKYVFTEIIDVDTGDKVDSFLEIPQSIDNPQKVIACVTYFRRATLTSLLSLQAEDDDGNKADTKPMEWLTEKQLLATSKGTPAQIKKVLEIYNGKNGKNMSAEYRKKLTSLIN